MGVSEWREKERTKTGEEGMSEYTTPAQKQHAPLKLKKRGRRKKKENPSQNRERERDKEQLTQPNPIEPCAPPRREEPLRDLRGVEDEPEHVVEERGRYWGCGD
jgi:hypothetical protein